METLIECNDLRHSYGEKTVLHGLTFRVERGGIFGLLGKNGAGKSTTINILMGYLRPTSGSCRVLGNPSHAITPDTRREIGLLHETFVQYDFMSIRQLERFYASFYPKWDRDAFYDLVDRLDVPHSRRLSSMSCGQRSQVILGLIMAQNPRLMILDDYSMGLDVGYRRLFIDYLREYVNERDTTVLLTSHVVQELDRIIDKMIILKNGKVALEGEKRTFIETFRCFQFDRSESSDRFQPDETIRNVEITGKTVSVFGFLDEQAVRNRLEGQGVPLNGFTTVPMDFEDAFIGLTGKY